MNISELLDSPKKLAVLQYDVKVLTDRLFALGKVMEEQSYEMGHLREEVRTRYLVLDKEMSEMEQRLMTLLEDLEDRLSKKSGNDILPTEASPERGVVRWSERKRAAERTAANPEVWKSRPTEAPKKEPNGDL